MLEERNKTMQTNKQADSTKIEQTGPQNEGDSKKCGTQSIKYVSTDRHGGGGRCPVSSGLGSGM